MADPKRQDNGYNDYHQLRARALFTPTEWETVKMLLLGYNAAQIAKMRNLSPKTIRGHWEIVKEKLNIEGHARWKLIWWAIEVGLVKFEF